MFGPPAKDPEARAVYEAALLADPARLDELRQRLGDLSWYMRCLNENIARRANEEEDRTGRFWEGRFESKPLADAQAVHACMAYNDLNPLRAGMVARFDAPQQTSLWRRLERCRGEHAETDPPLSWRDRDTWLSAFAAQRRRGRRRGETPAWLAAIA